VALKKHQTGLGRGAGLSAVLATAGLLASAGLAHGQFVYNQIPLNYNFNGMCHAGEQGQPDAPLGYRSISDRGVYVDSADPHAFGTAPLVGFTGLTYSIVTQPNVVDIVNLGNRNQNNPFDTTGIPGTNANVGVLPDWATLATIDHRGIQTTNLSSALPITALTQVGVLVTASNSGGSFTVRVGYTDATTQDFAVNIGDWCTINADPTNTGTGVVSTKRLQHTYLGTTYNSFTGVSNSDNATVNAFNTNLTTNSPCTNMQVIEVVLRPGAVASSIGKSMNSISFLNATGATGTSNATKGWAIYAATVRTGAPADAACAGATAVTPGDTAFSLTSDYAAGDGVVTGVGTNDTNGKWFRFTATQTGQVVATTCAAATFDTTLAVYASCGGAALAANDNACGLASRVTFNATAGQTYYVRVAGNNAATGTGVLGIYEGAHTDITMPLAFNWNGICHGLSEQTYTTPAPGNENRCDASGYRSMADRGLLCDGIQTDALNYLGTYGYQGMQYNVYGAARQSDMIHLGNRNLVANGARAFIAGNPCPVTGNNNGIAPTWLNNVDQTTPQTSSMAALGAVFGPSTRVGVLYHADDVPTANTGQPQKFATVDMVLAFTDGSSTTVTLSSPDWFGTNAQVLPAASSGSGLESQRLLGLYHATQNTDQASDAGTGGRLKVFEAVVSTPALIDHGFNPVGKTLASVTFQNIQTYSNATNMQNGVTNSTTSGFAIYSATLRDPQSFNLNFGPSAVGNASPSQVIAGSTARMLVTVSRGSGSPNNITSVVVDGSPIGLSSSLQLFDNGTNGDQFPNDNIWSRTFSAPVNASLGNVTLNYTVTDGQARTYAGTIVFTVTAPTAAVTPASVKLANAPLYTVSMSLAGAATPNISSVVVDASGIGLGNVLLNDAGTNGDVAANNGVYSAAIRVPLSTAPGTYALPWLATDTGNATVGGTVSLTVANPAVAVTPTQGFAGLTATVTVDTTASGLKATGLTAVQVDASSLGLSTINLNDAGTNGDATANDGIYTAQFTVPQNAAAGLYALPVNLFDASSAYAASVNLRVVGITDLGTLPDGTVTRTVAHPTGNEVHWYRFVLPHAIDRAALQFIDLDTEGSTLSSPTILNDTMLGLYRADGTLVVSDDDDGTDGMSQISIGLDNPARPAPGNGLAYNGRDGATLPAGTYYVALCAYSSTFGANFGVTSTSTYTGTLVLNIRVGTVTPGSPPASFTELGQLADGAPITAVGNVTPGGIAWFHVTLPSVDAAARTYLDIDTEGSALADTVLAVYRDDGTGTLVGSDDNDGSGLLSQLSYGKGSRPAVGDGMIYNGRDGATFTGGNYYIGVAQSPTIFASQWVTFNQTGTGSGQITLRLRTGFQNRVFAGPFFNPGNGSTYYLLESNLSFNDAESAAISDVGGHLAAISDASENEWVRANVLQFDNITPTRRAFIGLYDSSFVTTPTGQTWAWTDGVTPFGFTNWGAGEPNNGGVSLAGQEHWVEMLGNGFWNDRVGTANTAVYAIAEVPSAAGICCRGSTCSVETPANCTVTPGSQAGAFTAAGATCNAAGNNSAPCCKADYNKVGGVELLDIFAFLGDWFANRPYADFNGQNGVDLLDIFAFLGAWFAGPCS
jgi:hypothetical protein